MENTENSGMIDKFNCEEWHTQMFKNIASPFEKWEAIKCPYCGDLIWKEIENKPIINFAPFILVFDEVCIIF
ncbi:MAG: hypothetical protein US83_C0006G0073 [Candidatus Falkowbacteria bacterium GW2011_GWC2_38_22]|uniref:Uncharacterized protein n=1 Tax=Candidatus Falkowbacteria bacterium GW2011_GWE1_38_31 TaxID=1618638 RepID=A0A0G0JWY4_9BACT|nr:MAG: hypothetical protein US73_C0001G0014 [Candidatus Falkowbacteria bacterium GW2011_GWF2_38_1205]KKQ61433.1 MAG: hypothetical protein US83_C0006G0073 [Candidatus Falkowbacteria bacterium GW2011_GWC2_38_22]KKQ63982.1 MAG: hypothetical protein US84_C0002G0014 [Candidatus Falkowbacteria bacterium GW2011_GWF1_38_22]KKQ66670.1 MAG: hypothetical protein US87_C0001G0191 [Candidatus Falkowbacteria bacterium GW2011_GWE2_38_254]KKQ71087.1 MAG: hypothetical protein US91_C0001G0014 [Candidatus Falkowb